MSKTVPTPVKSESRSGFGIEFFKTKLEAAAFAKLVVARRDTHHGGFYHGVPCGREAHFDYVDSTYGPLYAVTVR